jgi:2-oxoisovalerate ferredoxin oxidoreductase delta subunit
LRAEEVKPELTESCIARPARPGRTGASWRIFKPVLDLEKCTKCYLCWKFCPDMAVDIDDEGWPWINYELCKGCGICVNECRPEALKLVREELL